MRFATYCKNREHAMLSRYSKSTDIKSNIMAIDFGYLLTKI